MQSFKSLKSVYTIRGSCYTTSALRLATTRICSRSYATENTDRLKGPVKPGPSVMQAVKNTIAENLGNQVLGSHSLAPADQQFSLEEVPDLTGKVALVTGGSEGIGYGCTHTLLSHNVSKLFILAKSDDIASDAINAIAKEMGQEKADRVVFIPCDLSDWEQTGKIALDISEKTDRLDILINNAGRGIMTYQLNKSGIDLHMATNHMGHVVLTSHLLPLIKSTAEKGNIVRLVQFGSNLHEKAPKETKFESVEELTTDYGAQPLYGRTKLASILYAKYLDRHLHSKYPNILSNAIHPGIVETRQTTEHIHEAWPLLGYGMSVAAQPFKKSQFEGCVSAMFAATKTEKSGQYICPPAIVEPGSDKANDAELGEKLMELTWKVVKEKTKSASEAKGCPFKES
jgi:NAD(P)-dependent dehydrogenase (short-subunit alcohol dehydrogenase family)